MFNFRDAQGYAQRRERCLVFLGNVVPICRGQRQRAVKCFHDYPKGAGLPTWCRWAVNRPLLGAAPQDQLGPTRRSIPNRRVLGYAWAVKSLRVLIWAITIGTGYVVWCVWGGGVTAPRRAAKVILGLSRNIPCPRWRSAILFGPETKVPVSYVSRWQPGYAGGEDGY